MKEEGVFLSTPSREIGRIWVGYDGLCWKKNLEFYLTLVRLEIIWRCSKGNVLRTIKFEMVKNKV